MIESLNGKSSTIPSEKTATVYKVGNVYFLVKLMSGEINRSLAPVQA